MIWANSKTATAVVISSRLVSVLFCPCPSQAGGDRQFDIFQTATAVFDSCSPFKILLSTPQISFWVKHAVCVVSISISNQRSY